MYISQAPRAGKIGRYYLLGIARFVPSIKFRRSLGECTKVFCHKIFSLTVKIFSVLLSRDGTEGVNENENKEKKNVDDF